MLHASVIAPSLFAILFSSSNLTSGKLKEKKNSSHTERMKFLPMSSKHGLWMMNGQKVNHMYV